jgi:DNA polymerase-3 subunit beta
MLDADTGKNQDIILPRKTVMELIKLLGDGRRCGAHPDRRQPGGVPATAAFELRSKVVDGKFPDYQRVIPVNNDKLNSTSIGSGCYQALSRAAILTNEKYRGVRLALTLAAACAWRAATTSRKKLRKNWKSPTIRTRWISASTSSTSRTC